jgi:two-component system cell cycle sensor histidine kinase/response regulator CckA
MKNRKVDMKTPLRVLIVEDSKSDVELILSQLEESEYSIHYERVETAKGMKAALEKQRWDIVISDYKLPGFNAPAALALLQKTKHDIPFIVVSGSIGEEDAVELMKAGAHDYLMKDKLARLVPLVKRELAEAQMRRKQKIVEEESLLLAQTVKSVRDCISITDLENKILFVNDSFLATYGYTEAELLGKNISIVRSSMVSSEVSNAIQSGTMKKGWHGEIRNRRKNGTEFTVELWTSVVMNSSASPVAMVGVARDITERKQAEETLAKEQFLMNMLMDNVPDHIYFKDKESRFIRMNKSLAMRFGLNDPAEAVGKTDFDFFTEQHAQPAFEDEQKIMKTDQPMIGLEEKETWPDGSETWVTTTKMPLRDKDGEIIGTFGISKDITERKQAEEALRQSQESYRRLFEDHSAVKIIIDPDTGLILDANHAAAQYYGWTREELKQMKIEQINTLSPEEVKIEMEKALVQKRIQFEFRHRRADGSVRDVEVFSSKIEIGGKDMLHSIIHDITERKRIEKALSESQALYHSFVEHMPAGVFRKDSEGRFVFVNSYFCQLKGLKADEIVGKTPHEMAAYEAAIENFRTPDTMGIQRTLADEGTEHHRLIMSTGRSIDLEEIYPQPDGTTRYYQVVKSPVFASDGKIIGTQGIQFDITERKKAEIELKESEERYRRLVEFSPDAIAVHSEGKIAYVNPAAMTLLGANSASELVGKPFLDIIHPDCRDSVHQQIIAVMKEEYAVPLTEQKFMRLDGSIVDVEVAAIPIIFKEKRAMQIVVRDISEQKKLQSQLLQTQKIQSIGTLAGGIAHDFNNILGIILAYSSLLNKSQLSPDKFATSITAINQAVQRGAALVRQILTFARKTDIVFEPMNISELIHELLSMLDQTFPKTITFSENIAESLPLIFADRTQVHQALLNLCVNARDAMPDGGSISIAAGKHTREQITQQFPSANEEAYVCLTVTDTGKGMDEATCVRIFDPFFTTKEKGKGTGLGLSVVYGVIQAHHGFIDLKSVPGRGTTFRLFFPVIASNMQTIDSQHSTESFEIGGTETILFVEDEEMLIQMVNFLLESKGYNVLCARDGLEAVNIYQSHKQEIALVITDLGLPVLTGSDEFKKLKEINPSVKVVFASGYFEPDIKSELLKDGAKGFIQKPYEPNDILRIIRQVLDQKA